MKSLFVLTCFAALASSALAAAPADAPAGSKGLCHDGSYSTDAQKNGACRGHKGVKDWYGEVATAAPMTKVGTENVTSAPTSAAMPKMTDRRAEDAKTQLPGGGPGLVWADPHTKVYHCNGDADYGKTKHGAYMSEAVAKAGAYRGRHAKACG